MGLIKKFLMLFICLTLTFSCSVDELDEDTQQDNTEVVATKGNDDNKVDEDKDD